MVFDKTKPKDTSKIRNLGSEIRANINAIVDAEDSFMPKAQNFTDRDAEGLSSDPSPIADAVIAYCKQNDDGDPRLFNIDPDSNIFQLLGGNLTDHGSSNYTLELGVGLTLKFGKSTASGSGVTTVFDEPYPNNHLGVVLSVVGYTDGIGESGVTVNGFRANLSSFMEPARVIYYFSWGN